MTLDQYLGTVAWLWIAHMLIVNIRMMCNFEILKHQIHYPYFPSVFFFYLPIVGRMQIWFIRHQVAMYLYMLAIWSAYPIYITYIG